MREFKHLFRAFLALCAEGHLDVIPNESHSQYAD